MISEAKDNCQLTNVRTAKKRSNCAFTIERAAGAIFGLPTYGTHVTAYQVPRGEMKVWAAKRAMSKSTFPGYMDSVSTNLPTTASDNSPRVGRDVVSFCVAEQDQGTSHLSR